jgi:two-component system response regulator YesN
MEAAMELLQTTSKSVTEVADDLDFENPFYFSRVFKKYYGIAPKRARYDAQKETLQADQRSGV